MLALVNALREFRHFLLGRRFHVLTDHRALIHVLNAERATRPVHSTIAAWCHDIMDFDFDVTHVPGFQNQLPDHLSRLYSQSDAWGVDNLIASHLSDKNGAAVLAPKSTLSEAISETQATSSSPASLHMLSLNDQKHTKKSELMRSLGKSIPAESERLGVIKQAHSEGHFGVRAVVDKIYNAFNLWWPSLRDDVENTLRSCDTCQRYDVVKRGYHPLRSPEVAMPCDWWQIDLVHMPESLNGHKYVLVVIDLFTSFVMTRPLKTKTAEETAHNLLQIWSEFGPPKIVQTDAGSEFMNSVLHEMSQLAHVELKASTPYYKHSTGSVERVNRTIAASLHKMLGGALAQWDTILPAVTHYYNTTVRSLTKTSPYALMFARASNPLMRGEEVIIDDFDLEAWCQDNDFESWLPEHHKRLMDTIERHKQVLSHIYPATQEAIKRKRRKTAERFEATHRIEQKHLEPGIKVLILDERRTSKHDQTWVGPYVIDSVNQTGSYILTDPHGAKLQRARSQIKPYHEDPERAEKDSYELDKIIRHRGRGNNVQYLVKWKGYSHQHNMWLKPSDFDDTKIISKYWDNLRTRNVPHSDPSDSVTQATRRQTTKSRSKQGVASKRR